MEQSSAGQNRLAGLPWLVFFVWYDTINWHKVADLAEQAFVILSVK